MACKQGFRSNLERAKEFYRKQRLPNPQRDYWSALVNRIYHTDAGYSGITQIERVYCLGCVVNGEVYNGGLHQFYSNSSGDRYSETLDALQQLGAVHSRRIVVRSCELLFPGMDAPPIDRQDRCRILPWWPNSPADPPAPWADELARLDKEYWADPDDLSTALTRYGIAHGLFTEPPADDAH